MRKPYFVVKATCGNPRCETGEFSREKKSIVNRGTGGQEYRIEVLGCPGCRQWARITDIEEVK